MRIKKKKKLSARYLPLDDIKQIDNDFLSELESVKNRLGFIKDEAVIKAFHEVLLSAYKAAIEIRTLEREVDYDIKFAEIEERRRALKPWRRCWLWRLLFQPLTNRAQDIIEERAELDADKIHKEAEKKLVSDRKELLSDRFEKLSERELKRLLRDELKATIERADNMTTNEAFYETPETPLDVPSEQNNADTVAPVNDVDNVQAQPARRPRPPRSCRRPATLDR